MARDCKKKFLADTIRKRTAKSLVSDFLKTTDLSECNWTVHDDGTIHVSAKIVEVRQTQVDVTIDELKDKLEEMKLELQTMPRVIQKEEDKDDSYLVGLRSPIFPIKQLP